MFSRQNFFSLAGIFLPRTNPGLSGNLSDSHKTDYLAAVEGLLKNARSFDNFKRNKKYQKILEHVSFSQGLNYLEILKPNILVPFHLKLKNYSEKYLFN